MTKMKMKNDNENENENENGDENKNEIENENKHQKKLKINKKDVNVKKRTYDNMMNDGENDNSTMNNNNNNAKNTSKLIIKNVAFEANAKELKELFNVYGKIKSLRLPKKFGGSHRGFCFIEFETPREASNALQALNASHFYKRHLVIEYASTQESSSKRTRIE